VAKYTHFYILQDGCCRN